MQGLLILGVLGAAAYFLLGGKAAANGAPRGAAPGQEIYGAALGAFRVPWSEGYPAGQSPIEMAITMYRSTGVEPRGLIEFAAAWNSVSDMDRSVYANGSNAVTADAANAAAGAIVQRAIQSTDPSYQHAAYAVAAGATLLGMWYGGEPEKDVLDTADWMARLPTDERHQIAA